MQTYQDHDGRERTLRCRPDKLARGPTRERLQVVTISVRYRPPVHLVESLEVDVVPSWLFARNTLALGNLRQGLSNKSG